MTWTLPGNLRDRCVCKKTSTFQEIGIAHEKAPSNEQACQKPDEQHREYNFLPHVLSIGCKINKKPC